MKINIFTSFLNLLEVNYKLILLIVTLLLNCTLTTFAQADYIVDLKQYHATKETKYIQHTMLRSFPLKDDSLVKGIPDMCEKYALHAYFINNDQGMYDLFRLGEITAVTYKRYTDTYKVDTTQLSDDIKNINNNLFLYVGLDTLKNEKYVIVDCNGDRDFANDSMYTFSLDEYSNGSPFRFQDSICPIIKINTKYYNGIEYVPVVTSVILNPFSAFEDNIKKYPSKEDFYLQSLLLTNNYFKGCVTINDTDLTVLGRINTSSIYQPTLGAQSRFIVFDSIHKGYLPDYAIGDMLIVAKRELNLINLDKNRLFIKNLGTAQDSCMIGDFVPQLLGKSTIEDKQITLNSLFKDKYVFIDFWGSWCAL